LKVQGQRGVALDLPLALEVADAVLVQDDARDGHCTHETLLVGEPARPAGIDVS